MKNVGIEAVGFFVPDKILTNQELERMVETSDEWILTRTGIKERRIAAQHERTSHLAIKAAQNTLENAGMNGEEIELIIVATATPDSGFPSVGCLVQREIGAKRAAAFDLSAACSGFLYALTTAKQFIQNGCYKNALVIAAEKFSNIVNWNDRSTCVLFGDGAGACLLSPVEKGRGILSDFIHAQGEYADLMAIVQDDLPPLCQKTVSVRRPYIEMDGQGLFKLAVRSMAEAVQEAVRRAHLDISDIDWVVPHQANDRIISAVAKQLGIPKSKFYINIHRYGNMSAAAIAVALYEAIAEKHIKRGDTLVLVTFGAGLVSAANVVKW